MVNRVYYRDRGFEAVEQKLSACGAWIERVAGYGTRELAYIGRLGAYIRPAAGASIAYFCRRRARPVRTSGHGGGVAVRT